MKMPQVPSGTRANGSHAQSAIETSRTTRQAAHALYFVLVACAAFALYLTSSFVLEAHKGTSHFGADAWYYTELARGDVLSRVAGNYYLDRITRFHPTTVFAAAAWLQILSPLERWIPPLYLLKAMFAFVGAAGVWAAMSAFATVASRRAALLFGVVYATSLGVWYFASIEESKIVTASLSTLYIAVYLNLRNNWTLRGAALLTAILLVACLNEVVSGFLVIIPLVDTLVRHGLNWREGLWIPIHALAGPVALVLMEGVLYGRLVGVSHPEGTSHVSMLLYYMAKNDYSLGNLYSFAINWLFFNMAAPSIDASYAVPAWAHYKGYFAPSLLSYLSSPFSAGAAALLGILVIASVMAGRKAENLGVWTGVLLGLAAYTLVRAAFFFLFNSYEPLLFSSAVTLAHMLMVAIPLATYKMPAKSVLLGAFALLQFIANGAFILFER